MDIRDNIGPRYGRLEAWKVYEDGSNEKVMVGPNAILYRGKSIMSRLLAGGLTPNTAGTYQYGRGPAGATYSLKVSGMAFGNGGHLLYQPGTYSTNTFSKATGGIRVANTVLNDPLKPAMPNYPPSTASWGYASVPNREVPGTTYEKVENGNIPWDGTTNISDNKIGADVGGSSGEANCTLYSETFRVPLDYSPAATLDGYSYPTSTEVQFKATLPQVYLNYTGVWGFANQYANLISEAGLICGYVPTSATLNTGQLYSSNGAEPTAAANDASSPVTFPATYLNSKDGTGSQYPGTCLLQTYKSKAAVVNNGVDTWAADGDNGWTMLARKNFPAITKTSSFSLVFVWTIGF